ncbi:MAG TPA: hypothetical protein VLM78_05810, partial [Anaerolineales bacterium]|nr:hypothetical protein [Anaerolineales bacterium]
MMTRHRSWNCVTIILGLFVLLLTACNARTPSGPEAFSGELAYAWVTRQCDLGYRITGTEA